METTRDEVSQHMDLMHDIASRVQQYAPGQLGWIARQMGREDRVWRDEYCIQIGKGVCCCSVEEAKNADDAFVQQLAAQVLGYEPNSQQDFEVRLRTATEGRFQINKEIVKLKNERDRLQSVIDEIESNMAMNGYPIPHFSELYARQGQGDGNV